MPRPLEEHCRQVMLENERGQKIFNAVASGWSSFDKAYPQRHRWKRKSSHRHMLWEEVIQKLYEVAAEDPGIRVIEHQDTVSFLIEGEILFRLKHATPTLITANYPTHQAESYDDHEVDLFGLPQVQRVKLCYVLNPLETNILWAGVVASEGGQFLWKVELDGMGAVPAVPSLIPAEEEKDTAKLARLKRTSTDAQQKPKNDSA